ncbi:MAG: terpene cyclase/mutase family protein [Planctomycetes bacterium]|nr:terpene cyclase/mutase family protein [Planctomycetota bacterium]
MSARIQPKRLRPWAPLLLGLAALWVPAHGQVPDSPSGESDEERVEITAEHAKAVTDGLEWLKANQNENGSWTADVGFKLNHGYRATKTNQGHVGVTSLAGMAFLAGGHFPGRGPYGKTVESCLDFVISCANEDGYITRSGTRMYSHAFATLFLAEIYGMTHREDVRAHLQKAVDFIVKSQNAEGGWRYVPLDRSSDMSIVVCQVLALRAARNIGIRVPKATIDRAIDYVVASADTGEAQTDYQGRRYAGDLGTFHYQKEDLARTTFPLTAAGVTALHGLGVYSSELIDHGVDFLESRVDHFNALYGPRGHYYFWYGHYYGVQAMHTVGGHSWRTYFESLREFLLEHQQADGTWLNQDGPGTAFSTAVACLILEIPYGYLPIFQR